MMDNCMNSMAPDDEELLRHVLDEEPLSTDAQEHLVNCSICQQRMADYAQTNRFLLSKLYRKQCPSATQLNFYCAGDILSMDETLHITEHIKECPLCYAEVVDIRAILRDFNPFPEDNADALAALRDMPKLLRRIVASFVDKKPQLALRGQSSQGQTGWPRQYRAENVNISLHLSRAMNGDILLLGLFTSDDSAVSVDAFEGAVSELYLSPVPMSMAELSLQDGNPTHPLMKTTVDDLGNLVFKSVSPGEYVMIVRLPDSEVVIEGLKIEH